MSIIYCSIPHFAVALARRDNPSFHDRPLVLIGEDRHVFAVSAEAATHGIVAGLPVRTAEVRCPQALLLEADVPRCRAEFETLLQLLDCTSPTVEPHDWGAAYVDLGDLVRGRDDAVSFCQELGRSIRQDLGKTLRPSLGWDSTKFTAQAAAQRTRPGHLMAIAAAQARAFLKPLPVTLLPLEQDPLRRLGFLGLRTLGQYAALPTAAVWQQFGRPGRLAQRCARGEDDRPVVPRSQVQRLTANYDLEDPLTQHEGLLALLQRLVSPLLAGLRDNLKAAGQMRLTVHLADGTAQEQEHAFLFPTAEVARVTQVLGQLLNHMHWSAGATALGVTFEKIQDVVAGQLPLLPAQTEREQTLREAQRDLAARFGTDRLRRAMLAHPSAPLPEWRVGWLTG